MKEETTVEETTAEDKKREEERGRLLHIILSSGIKGRHTAPIRLDCV